MGFFDLFTKHDVTYNFFMVYPGWTASRAGAVLENPYGQSHLTTIMERDVDEELKLTMTYRVTMEVAGVVTDTNMTPEEYNAYQAELDAKIKEDLSMLRQVLSGVKHSFEWTVTVKKPDMAEPLEYGAIQYHGQAAAAEGLRACLKTLENDVLSPAQVAAALEGIPVRPLERHDGRKPAGPMKLGMFA